jgi:hypothetical protein
MASLIAWSQIGASPDRQVRQIAWTRRWIFFAPQADIICILHLFSRDICAVNLNISMQLRATLLLWIGQTLFSGHALTGEICCCR